MCETPEERRVMALATPIMMTDEESDGEGGNVLTIRRPPWRTDAFDKLIRTLDERVQKEIEKDRSRMDKRLVRKYIRGSYLDRPCPKGSVELLRA